jgi:hypothetical protein
MGRVVLGRMKSIQPSPYVSKDEVAVGKLKRYISPGINQIPAELIHAGR